MVGVFFIIAASTLWALDSLIRYPLIQGGVSAISIVFYEHFFLTLIFAPLFFRSLSRIWNAKLSDYFYFVVLGAVGSALATLAFTRAFYFLNPSLVIMLQKFQPVVAIILARLILKEQVKQTFIFWTAVSLVGAFLIGHQDLADLFRTKESIQDVLFHSDSIKGYLLVFLSVVGWGAATVFGKKLSVNGYENKEIMAGRFIVGLFAIIPFAFNEGIIFSHQPVVYGKVVVMVLISGLLAMYLYYQGLSKISARAASLAEMFFPFMAIIVNWIALDAKLTLLQLAGGAILFIASLIIQLKKY